jgi:hypothetical protein
VFSEIDGIRKETNDSIRILEGGKEIHSYFGDHNKKNEKITREDAEGAVRFFLEIVRKDIDSRLSMYIYSEAQVLKDTLERIDQYTDGDD